MNWHNVDNAFLGKAILASLTASTVAGYLYIRKKIRLFLWLSAAFLVDSILLTTGIPYYQKFMAFLILLVIVLVVNRKEISALDQSGLKAADAFKIDNADRVFFVVFIIAYILARIFIVDIE